MNGLIDPLSTGNVNNDRMLVQLHSMVITLTMNPSKTITMITMEPAVRQQVIDHAEHWGFEVHAGPVIQQENGSFHYVIDKIERISV